MKQNTLAKQLNLRNFRRRLIADAYARAQKRAEAKIAAMSTTTVGIETERKAA